MQPTPIQAAWLNIENWLKDNVPTQHASLNPPATLEQIAEFEQRTGCKLPQPLVELSQMHNGQAEDAARLFFKWQWLPVERIAEEWVFYRDDAEFDDDAEPEGCPDTVKAMWWNPLWLPFAHDGSGNHICLDMDPDTDGTVGK